MFISPKQAGQVAATLGVGLLSGVVAKKLTSSLYTYCYNLKNGQKKENIKADEAHLKTANKVLNVVSLFIGVAVGAFFANYKGYISLNSLISRFSTLYNSASKENNTTVEATAQKVNTVVEQTPVIEPKVETSTPSSDVVKEITVTEKKTETSTFYKNDMDFPYNDLDDDFND